MTPTIRRAAVFAATVVALAACGGSDWARPPVADKKGATATSARGPVTTLPGGDGKAGGVEDADRPECQELRVLLKLDVTGDQRRAIEQKLKSIAEVARFRFEEAPAQSHESSSYHVRPKSLDQLQKIGAQIEQAGLAGIVSVIYPRQFC